MQRALYHDYDASLLRLKGGRSKLPPQMGSVDVRWPFVVRVGCVWFSSWERLAWMYPTRWAVITHPGWPRLQTGSYPPEEEPGRPLSDADLCEMADLLWPDKKNVADPKSDEDE